MLLVVVDGVKDKGEKIKSKEREKEIALGKNSLFLFVRNGLRNAIDI